MKRPPIIFLFGPPGAGKTTLGSRACKELGLAFLDLAGADLEQLSRVVRDTSADMIELPWALQHERRALTLVRRSGTPLVLWAHPEDMQARSDRDEPLFTPVPRLKIRGGFGRNGTGCREFRHLQRACGKTLMLVDLALAEAAGTSRDPDHQLSHRARSGVHAPARLHRRVPDPERQPLPDHARGHTAIVAPVAAAPCAK